MIGGLGDDTYTVDDAGDVVTEAVAEGTDTVNTAINYTLGANVENLTATVGTGLTMTGNALANTITGGDGNDIIDGAAGADTMIGGLGDDTYTVDDAGDVVTEAATEGTDTVNTSVNYALAVTGSTTPSAPMSRTSPQRSAPVSPAMPWPTPSRVATGHHRRRRGCRHHDRRSR